MASQHESRCKTEGKCSILGHFLSSFIQATHTSLITDIREGTRVLKLEANLCGEVASEWSVFVHREADVHKQGSSFSIGSGQHPDVPVTKELFSRWSELLLRTPHKCPLPQTLALLVFIFSVCLLLELPCLSALFL